MADNGNEENPAAVDCETELRKLYDAMMLKLQGRNRTKARYEDQESEYGSVRMADLEGMYRAWYNQCGAQSGLPDITNKQLRGGPAHVKLG
jgi:hypothetical protein